MNILIFDKSLFVHTWLRREAEKIGSIEIFGSPDEHPERRQAIQTIPPDVIILDPHADDDGIKKLRKLKKIYKSSVIIIFANQTRVLYEKRYLQAGADYFFDKSLDFKKLIQTLRSLRFNQQLRAS